MPQRMILPMVCCLVAAVLLEGCGSQGQAAPPQSGMRPSSGHVITNPTPAQAFIYLPMTVQKEKNGDLLILDAGKWDGSGSKIVEMNSQGKPIWEYTGGMYFPHSAYPAGKKDILISDTNDDRVFMINRHGKTIWSTDTLGGGKGLLGQGRFSDGGRLLYPNDAVMMPHKQILISSRFNNSVWQIKRNGEVTWSCKRFMFRQHRARLVKGNLWVPDSDNARVIIINHSCSKILFNYGGKGSNGKANLIWPRSFNPYPGGNYIISDSGPTSPATGQHARIIEINSQKQIVQSWNNLPSPYYVEVQKNGDLLLGDSGIHGAILLGPHGGIVKQYPTTDPNSYASSVQNGGFESGLKSWLRGDMTSETLPAGHHADMGIAHGGAQSGKASAYINWPKNKAHLPLFFLQTLSVTPGKRYHFTGYIKTENVQACSGCDHGKFTQPVPGAYYYIQYVKPNDPNILANPGFDPGNGLAEFSQGWTKFSQSFVPPPGVTEIQVEAVMAGRGKAFFDAVSVT